MNHKNQQGFGLVEAILVLVVLVALAVLGWYIFNRQTAPELRPVVTDESTIGFSEEHIPYSFMYPKTWTVEKSQNLKDGALPDQYSITLSAPQTVLVEQPLGGSVVTKGVRIVVVDSKTGLTSIKDRFTGIYATAQNKKDVSVGDQSAVQFSFSYESDPGIYTEFVKNGRLYSIQFFAEGDEMASGYIADYQKIVSSFVFK
ncbi:MAG TPA: hypothetical protein VFO38_03970 [Candidatus Saccharimonadales bacterium]|nr:hypothetical protein [Candidatus Saccharimonadales bacterium]